LFVPEKLYRDIISYIPIVCVDIIVNKNKKFLLLKRNNPPLKNSWYLPGGRINIGESIEEASIRKIYEELGINVLKKQLKLVGIYQDKFDVNSFGEKKNYSTISIVFEINILNSELILDSQSSKFKWADKLPARFTNKTTNIQESKKL
tara:strand:- start:271 stop:714 length:444 start_codon:yes stop_codon:yes gene_type:complete